MRLLVCASHVNCGLVHTQVDGQAVIPCMTLMEAGCAFAMAIKDDATLATPTLLDITNQTPIAFTPGSPSICIEIFQTGALNVTFAAKRHDASAMSCHTSSTISQPVQEFSQTKRGRRAIFSLLVGRKSRSKQKRRLCPLHACAMALVACVRDHDNIHGFWVQPGATKALLQLNAFVHMTPRDMLPCPYLLQSIGYKTFVARYAMVTLVSPSSCLSSSQM